VPRSAVAIALPGLEFSALREHLAGAGYEAVAVATAADLKALLDSRSDIRVAILDAESDFDGSLEMYALLHEDGRNLPALILMPPQTLGVMGLVGRSYVKDEYFKRPYSAESLRWRIEAMLIRVENIPAEIAAAMGPILAGEHYEPDAASAWAGHGPQRGQVIIVFNPKGGVGKTTIATNLGSTLRIRKHQRVLIVDGDTTSGHIATSLGLANPRTLASTWLDYKPGDEVEPIVKLALAHPSGLSVVVMADSPLHLEILVPGRVAEAITIARASYDFVILDMHPDYGPLNRALLALADRILVPVTPDVPCIRAAVQFREVAVELGVRERIVMVINRANSGVASSDVERVVGIPSLARIRSAGMLFARAADEGKLVLERYPKAKVLGDLDALADRLLAPAGSGADQKHGRPPTGRVAGAVRSLFDRLSAQVP
jgi:MinD-like ATPase involved in chromosome partitioning or flagellar assembly